jgi:hypothetical protein
MTHISFFNPFSGDFHSKFRWTDFYKGWKAMRDNANPLVEPHIPLVAFDVVSNPGEGIPRCVRTKPEILSEEGV